MTKREIAREINALFLEYKEDIERWKDKKEAADFERYCISKMAGIEALAARLKIDFRDIKYHPMFDF